MGNKINLTFLGTSSQVPTPKRNHTSILLTYNEENILVDCGEGTQRQFRIARLNPCKITRILITHLHGDHVLGLPGLFQTLALSGYNKTLKIYGPKGIYEFIQNLLQTFKFQREYDFEINEVVNEGVFFENNDFYLESLKLEHGCNCNGYNFVKKSYLRINKEKIDKLGIKPGKHMRDLKEGKDIEYNGKKYKAKDLTYSEEKVKVSFILDTKFKKEIVKFVDGADVLVSEATYSKDLKDQAKEYNHMTAQEAGKLAKQAKVKKLLLTHLSQRYEYKKKEIFEEAKKEFENSKVVKDFDVVNV